MLSMAIDPLDLEILSLLRDDGRMTFTDLAQRVGLTGPSVADRVRRLEGQGIIRGFSARLDPAALGLTLTAFIAISLSTSASTSAFLDDIGRLPQIVECHHIAGQEDYLLKVHVAGTRGLEQLISDSLKAIPGVIATRTTVVLSTPCERTVAPPHETGASDERHD